jgi:hypothetical protein
MTTTLSSHAHGSLVDDPFESDAAGMPYSTQADYLPIRPEAMGTLFLRDRSNLVDWRFE